MKKIFLIILLFFSNNILYAFSGGVGTKQNPYQIYNIEDLKELADSVNYSTANNWSAGKYFILTNDITEPVNFCIGAGSPPNARMFYGNFDGQGYSINLAIEQAKSDCFALFSIVNSCEIKNLTVNGYVNGDAAGGIVGVINTSLVSLDDTVKIINCINNSKINAKNAGGIVYCVFGNYNSYLIISNCINLGSILAFSKPGDANGIALGGIIGRVGIAKTIITNCINYAFIYADSVVFNNLPSIVGGIWGIGYDGTHTNNYAIISNCANFGIVRGPGNVGCIVGFQGNRTTVINCHYDKQMCGGDD